MLIKTEQLPSGRWRYLLVTEDGRQMGYSQYDYASEDAAREYGEDYLKTAGKDSK